MRIQNNMLAINTSRVLNVNQNKSSKAIEKLSSGFRINRSGDDAAGLGISEKMRGQIRGLNQASRNAQDAISLVQTAEGAANEMHAIVQRMRQLSVQSASDTYVNEDRTAFQNEIDELVKEVDRIASTTEFNGMTLLDGSFASSNVSQAVISDLTSKLPAYLDDAIGMIEPNYSMSIGGPRNLSITYYSDSSSSTGASMGTSDGGASLEMRINLANVTDNAGDLIAEEYLDTLITHEVMHAYQFINMPAMIDGADREKETWFLEGLAMLVQGGNGFAVTDHNVSILSATFDGDYRSAYEATKVLHEITNGGIDAIVARLAAGDDLDQAINNTTQDFAGTELAGANGAADFTDVTSFIGWFNANATTDATTINYLATSNDFTQGSGVVHAASTKGSNTNLTLANSVTNDASAAAATAAFNISFTNPSFGASAGSLKMQIGANFGQEMDVSLGNLTAANLGVNNLKVDSQINASNAIKTLDAALKTVSEVRSSFGATQNRLEHTVKNIDNTAENLQSSESRIRDVDMASEMMNFTKLNILSQAAQSMLAQANQAPQGVLQLLR